MALSGKALSPGLVRDIENIPGPHKVFAAIEDRLCYSYDGTFKTGVPGLVFKPTRTEQVSRLLALASEAEVPVVPRGAGTNLSGGSVPVDGGIVLCTADMNRILEIRPADSLAAVEPGVITARFQRTVEAQGLFYPPDPASGEFCTLGGNIAEGSGGPRGLKYGTTRDYVLGLEAVLASGEVILAGGKTIKNVTGYDLARLLVGSEGTLAVITKAYLRLLPKPAFKRTILAAFSSLDDAGEAIARVIGLGTLPTTLEIMDGFAIRAVENFLGLGFPAWAEAMLLIEVDGHREAVESQIPGLEMACLGAGAKEVRIANDEAESQDLWRARRSVSPAVTQLAPNKITEDATVPRGQVPEMIRRLQKIRDKYQLPLVIYGHAGDGNLHPNIAADKDDAELMVRVDRAVEEIFEAALDLGGTLSGEHGIGLLKRPYLEMELGRAGIEVTRRIKTAFDPKNILNPGKII